MHNCCIAATGVSGMVPSAEEIGRSLGGALRLMNRDAEGLDAFEVSLAAYWRSFAAIVLTAPAFVVALADHRIRSGLPPEAGLFSDPGLVAVSVVEALVTWVAFPLAMIAIVRPLGLGHRYIGYVVAYNWSAVVAAFVFAVPTAMRVLGLVPGSLAMVFAFFFGILIVHWRWFIAKAALGVSGGLAAVMVAIDVAIAGALSMVI